MPLLPSIGRTVGTAVKATRMLVRGSVRSGAWATRRVGSARARGAAGEIGMIRLFDLHAVSCAGDALIAIGLAGTIFFNVPLGEARGKVALYLLITMVPFALLAPVVGPLLDHFRHGRRYALAVTMLGRAFLAYVISDHLFGWGLYPAAFGVLALSRAYGVARSAAVPRLLPEGVGLSQVGARASVYGTFAGAVVAPIGLLAFKFGPQWPLRVSSIIFIVGMVIALRLPPRADSDPPEAVPQPWRAMLRLGRGADRPLSGKLVVASLIGSASLRLLYGFLLLFLTFVVVGNQLDTHIFGTDVGHKAAVGVVGGALAVGTFLSTAVGTRLRIRRPLALQAAGLTVTAAVAVLAAVFYSLLMVALFALITSIFSGIAKLAIDASIQERIPERLRASAFAHSETVLMIAWVTGGGIGLIPLPGRLGVALGALLAVAGAVRAGIVATRLHNERLSGRSHDTEPSAAAGETAPSEPARATAGPSAGATAGPSAGATAGPSAGATAGPSAGATAGPSAGATAGPSGGATAGSSGRAAGGSSGGATTGPSGRAAGGPSGGAAGGSSGGIGGSWAEPSTAERRRSAPADPWPEAPTVPERTRPNPPHPRNASTSDLPPAPPRRSRGSERVPPPPARGGARGPARPAGSGLAPPAPGARATDRPIDPTLVDPKPARKGWFGRRKDKDVPPQSPGDSTPAAPVPAAPVPDDLPADPAPTQPDPALAPPGFHVYRPTSTGRSTPGTPPLPDDEDDL